MYAWTQNEIEKILIQLNEMQYPFKNYCFSGLGQGLDLLGNGAYAYVYQAYGRKKMDANYVIKVVGFSDKIVDSEEFQQTVAVQRDLAYATENVVKMYEAIELYVWLDPDNTVTRVAVAGRENIESSEQNYITLQFIVMEKLVSVLSSDIAGKRILFPKELESFNEREVRKFAYDIGNALAIAHKKKILHRDIKLENIFYDTKKKCYKLGDFGIAKFTSDGVASTTAFTKGYGAPEVVSSLTNNYDNTADIYSYGMVLYVLMNGLRFPGSENYNVNPKEQYSKGYILPPPCYGTNEFGNIIEKLCRFDPDERYQTVDEMLYDLDIIEVNKNVGFQKQHMHSSFLMGMIFMGVASAVWKFVFMPHYSIDLSWGVYLFYTLCVVKCVRKTIERDNFYISVLLLILGIYILISTGFEGWKIVMILVAVFSKGIVIGIISEMLLVGNVIGLFIEKGPYYIAQYTLLDYQWIMWLSISLAMILFYYYILIKQRDRELTRIYFHGNVYWYGVMVLYVVIGIVGFLFSCFSPGERLDPGGETIGYIISFMRLDKVGFCGAIFSVTWIIRERILMKTEK